MADTAKFGRTTPSPPRPNGEDTLYDKVSRIDATLIDLRIEMKEWADMQARGNKISLLVQGDVEKLRKEVNSLSKEVNSFSGAIKGIAGQNDEILKLLRSRK